MSVCVCITVSIDQGGTNDTDSSVGEGWQQSLPHANFQAGVLDFDCFKLLLTLLQCSFACWLTRMHPRQRFLATLVSNNRMCEGGLCRHSHVTVLMVLPMIMVAAISRTTHCTHGSMLHGDYMRLQVSDMPPASLAGYFWS